MITSETVLKRSENIVVAPLGEELVMMNIESGTYYVLDEVGSYIWSCLSTPTSVTELLRALQEDYEVGPDRCEREVVPFLERISAKQLISPVDR